VAPNPRGGPWNANLPVIRNILSSPTEVALAASLEAAALIRHAIAQRGTARIVAATGVSQEEFLALLVAQPEIPWERVVLFHLDEYLGIPPEHPASMHRYIQERIVKPTAITQTFLLDGTSEQTHIRAAAAICATPADVAFTGIGENGHLAFNEPPADFTTEEPFIVVNLAARSRQQQVNEGWFNSLEDVPQQAITMSVRQILKARSILCIATGTRKAPAVQQCFAGEISPFAPASALRIHPEVTVYFDSDAAALLEE
jgi:glucosamine-6-phosphate deaminase